MPEWDLSDLYSSASAKEIVKDLKSVEQLSESFASKYEKKLSTLSATEMLICLRSQEKITGLMGRLMSFAALRYYQMTTDVSRTKLLSDIQDKITQLSAKIIFFSLEFNTLNESHLNDMLNENSELRRYRTAFDRMRAMKPYQLSDELEKFLHEQSVVGATAWNRLFDETIISLKFNINKKDLSLEEVLNQLTDTNRRNREKAARSLSKALEKNITLFSRITNTLAKEKSIEDKWRKFPNPQFSRHLTNDVEEEVVKALRDSVVDSYSKTSHRYYKLKAKWLGLKKLEIWDRNAPLPQNEEKVVSWSEARSIVTSAYTEFDPRMDALVQPFFEKGWIDAAVKPGKAPGAFSHPTVTDVHPYILLNYLGKPRDIMTLAHELGHGVHQSLSSSQGEILANTPLTLAETASVFGEMLTFQKMLSESKSEINRKQLLAGKVEDMINTVVRQISFYDFECRVHHNRQLGELTPDQINKIWLDVSKESLGPAFNYAKGYENFWAYVPHFVHSPFYVYAYAFGDGLVNALYSAYQSGVPNFEDKYFELLSSGGSKHHSQLLKPFQLDASDPTFWTKGLDLISSMIDELEELQC
ncbi:M3 family oligoendopeptidase [Rhodobacteraceae bacterium]|nr:M3 family oligoendopeptidase [Paracoccaceae bacterium]